GADIIQIRRDPGWMDLRRTALLSCFDAREVALEPGLFLLSLREPTSHLGRRITLDDELAQSRQLLPCPAKLIEQLPAFGFARRHISAKSGIDLLYEPCDRCRRIEFVAQQRRNLRLGDIT